MDFTKEETYRLTRVPVQLAHTLTPEAYRSTAYFEIERERVFATSWVCVGYTSQLAEPELELSRWTIDWLAMDTLATLVCPNSCCRISVRMSVFASAAWLRTRCKTQDPICCREGKPGRMN